MTGEENYVEHALHVGAGPRGLTLEQLGFEPRLEDLTEDQRSRLDADDLEWAASVTPERRDRSLFQAKLLAGALWEASAVLIDQLFEDLDGLRDLDRVDRQDIANTFVLSGLPPRHADKYDVRFAQQFLLIAADMTGALTRGWTRPSCVAQELALRCLLTTSRSFRTCMTSILQTTGVATLNNTCSKTQTARCSTRTPWTASKATSN
jgi:hypothetical protein